MDGSALDSPPVINKAAIENKQRNFMGTWTVSEPEYNWGIND
jgi:hypothetical protein